MSTLSSESPGHTSSLSYKPGSDWPHLSTTELVAIVAVNVGSLFAAWLLLRVWWKPPSEQEIRLVENRRCSWRRHVCADPLSLTRTRSLFLAAFVPFAA